MRYRFPRFASAALLALSTAHPALAQESFSKAEAEAALRELTEATPEVQLELLTCNPFIDPGCNRPSGPVPGGCTDCLPADIIDMFSLPGRPEILRPDRLELGDGGLLLRQQLTPDQIEAIELAPQIGF